MINAYLNECQDDFRVHGLYQWDCGQTVNLSGIPIPDDTEMQFYQGYEHKTYLISNMMCRVPDIFLRSTIPIEAYIYLQRDGCERTVKHLTMYIKQRPKPTDYVDKEDKSSISRLVPAGGKTGQYLTKTSDDDYDTRWADIDTNIDIEAIPEETIIELFADMQEEE